MDDHRVKHMEMIQGVINRPAGNSTAMKGWSVTIVAAMLAILAGQDGEMVLFALVPAIAFWGLDAFYLRLERLYRQLYDAARRDDDPAELFSMDFRAYKADVASWLSVMGSRSVLGFHLPLTLSVFLIGLCFALFGAGA